MGEKSGARWQSEITSLRQGCRRLYDTKELSDITFTIKGETNFRAHKLILAARSIEFQRLLLNSNVPNPIFIENEFITANGFQILLRFIYTDEIGTEEKIPILEAFIASEYYKQNALKDLCEKKMNSWTITPDNVWELLDAGLSVPVLKDKCLAFIKQNANGVISHPTFLKISFNCLIAILDSEVLKSVPVLQRLTRIMDWAGEHYTSYKSVRNSFEENKLLSKLEIETLKLEELRAVVKKFKGLITPDEVVQFMEYSEDNDPSCLPPWCVPSC